MKKVNLLVASVMLAYASFGQTVANAGMETWRTGSSGGVGLPPGPVVPITAPIQWYGFDSLIINLGETYGSLAGFGTDWNAQLFKETTIVHSGSASAKVMTRLEDGLGFWAGVLSNAQAAVDIPTLIGGGDPASAISFSGGTPVTQRITTVSAWVEYFAGKDSITGVFGGPDKGLMTVQAVAVVGGVDTIIGTGAVDIAPCTSFTQVTATLAYTTHLYDVSILRIIFASSGGGGAAALDSSILYVDDVTMTGEPQGVNDVANSTAVKVFPNPANGVLYAESPAGVVYTLSLQSVSGQVVATQKVEGHTNISISQLPAGIYFYAITDVNGAALQRGKVNVMN